MAVRRFRCAIGLMILSARYAVPGFQEARLALKKPEMSVGRLALHARGIALRRSYAHLGSRQIEATTASQRGAWQRCRE